MARKFKSMDGNNAAAYVSYAFTEVAGIYPITPSSPMADYVGHGSQVHNFLNVALSQHGETGLAASHHVAVVTEDIQSVGGNGTGTDVEHARQLLSSDLVHVGDHQQQTLGCGVSGGQSTCAQRAVHGTGSAGLGLHLNNLDLGAEDVLQTVGGPLAKSIMSEGNANLVTSTLFSSPSYSTCIPFQEASSLRSSVKRLNEYLLMVTVTTPVVAGS